MTLLVPSDYVVNSLGGKIDWLVLPNSDHDPPIGTEGFSHFTISSHIAR
jgi:hypothetical protein